MPAGCLPPNTLYQPHHSLQHRQTSGIMSMKSTRDTNNSPGQDALSTHTHIVRERDVQTDREREREKETQTLWFLAQSRAVGLLTC